MTVIAWDGVRLAADKRVTIHGLPRTTTKIRRIKSLLVGVAGEASMAAALFRWVEDGRKPEGYPQGQRDRENNSGLLVIEHKRVFRYEFEPYPYEIEDAFYAMGSGRDYAMAAMHLGHSATEAVEVACALDISCGNGIDVLEVL